MSNRYQVKVGEFLFEALKQPMATKRVFRGENRDTLLLVFHKDVFGDNNPSDIFVDDCAFSIIETVELMNVSGLPSREYEDREYSKELFCVAGDITDHRDGTLSILMGKKTDRELLEEENAVLLFENLTGEDF